MINQILMAATPSQYGSPELQELILAKLTEKAAAEAVTEGEYEAALEGTPPATQAALTAALEALRETVMGYNAMGWRTEHIDAAIAQIEALGVKHGGI